MMSSPRPQSISTIRLVPAAAAGPAGPTSVISPSTVTVTNTSCATPRMIVPAVLIPKKDGNNTFAQLMPSTPPKTGQIAGPTSSFPPLIISSLSPGLQQNQNQVLGLLTPVISKEPQMVKNTEAFLHKPSSSGASSKKFKIFHTKAAAMKAKEKNIPPPPPLQPAPHHQLINVNKLKHVAGLNQFQRLQPYAIENSDHPPLLKVSLKKGNKVVDVKHFISNLEPTPSPEKKPETPVTTEGKQGIMNINITHLKDYVNEFPHLITIHGLTSEKSEVASVNMNTALDAVEQAETVEVPSEILTETREMNDEPMAVTTEDEDIASTSMPEPATAPEAKNEYEEMSEPAVSNQDSQASDEETFENKMDGNSLQCSETLTTPEDFDMPEHINSPEIKDNAYEETPMKTPEKVEEVVTEIKDEAADENKNETSLSQESNLTENTESIPEEPAVDSAEDLMPKKREFKRPSILGSRKRTGSPAKCSTAPVQPKAVKVKSQTEVKKSKASTSKDDNLDVSEFDDKNFQPMADDFDPVKLLEWKDGVGVLPGSNLKFRMNEFGLMEMVEEEPLKGTPKKVNKCISPPKKSPASSPVIEGKKRSRKEKLSPDDIYCCESCGCYGMASEFNSQRFCSMTCEEEAAKRRAEKSRRAIELEELRLKRKRKRLHENNLRLLALQQRDGGEDGCDEPTPNSADTPTSTAQNSPTDTPVVSDSEEAPAVEPEPPQQPPPPPQPTPVADGPLLPWQVVSYEGKVSFSWPKYLEHLKARAAPTKLFPEHGFPYQRNGFRAGMRLEGIDPRCPSHFCALSVADVNGYRLKLHFEGWPDNNDFWVNADSKDIFMIGFCEKTGRNLIPPRGYPKSTFNWTSYLKLLHATAAPRHLFLHRTNAKNAVGPSGFRLGMKLEAVDKQNQDLVCVATVADILDGRLLVHFDSWDNTYDYWVEPSSPYIHPVGWCEENGRRLTPPYGRSNFEWDTYLKETKSTAVPSRAFKPKPAPPFKKSMKLECVDPRYPELIRVATVSDVKNHRIQISFDGWPLETAIWVDTDSPDIHPLGWCNKTGHPLTPPPCPNQEHPCITPGCRALLKNSQFILPHSSGFCPLSPNNLNKTKKPPHKIEEVRKAKAESSEDMGSKAKVKQEAPEPPSKKRKVVTTVEKSIPSATLRMDIHESVFSPGYLPSPLEPSTCWLKHAELLNINTQKLKNEDPVKTWSPEQVKEFVQTLPGCGERSKVFVTEQIDGESLLMLSQSDLINFLGFKVGQAIKLFNSIIILKQAQKVV